MPRYVDREYVHGLLGSGAQIVEVLGADEFEEWHLPGAVSLPLRRIDKSALEVLDPTRPVVVYCWDTA